ncbi:MULTISPECIES: hypothetical protein [unclassified Bradyrhizobium]|uniref:hypothetical protein n=1 Tax=unclassified Bradyrhizobium TaxID=2631580 RepID=UPI00116111C3|nr:MULTISPECIES: hypothetical protein [unclassified Bradyrhizobium]
MDSFLSSAALALHMRQNDTKSIRLEHNPLKARKTDAEFTIHGCSAVAMSALSGSAAGLVVSFRPRSTKRELAIALLLATSLIADSALAHTFDVLKKKRHPQ